MIPKAIVTDIEGTTTALSFVKDTLFPYSRERLAGFVEEHADEATVRAALNELKVVAGDPEMADQAAVKLALQYIDEDRKVGPLKVLQGLIWESGYKEGAYKAHVYEDVEPKLREALAADIELYVYSSGSVFAQKLLFAHTNKGDLTPLFSGYFDTSTGPKKESPSYTAIAKAIGLPAERVLFLSDAFQELDAARSAGMMVTGVDRDHHTDRGPDRADPHPWVHTFADLPGLSAS